MLRESRARCINSQYIRQPPLTTHSNVSHLQHASGCMLTGSGWAKTPGDISSPSCRFGGPLSKVAEWGQAVPSGPEKSLLQPWVHNPAVYNQHKGFPCWQLGRALLCRWTLSVVHARCPRAQAQCNLIGHIVLVLSLIGSLGVT